MTTREQLLETAITRVVDYNKADRAGDIDPAGNVFNTVVQPAVDAAHAAGWGSRDLFGEADRRYGQWLIDNAGK